MHKRRLIQFALAGLAGLTIHPLAAATAGQGRSNRCRSCRSGGG